MTIQEAISRVDRLKYNVYTQAEKQRWLGMLEAQLKTTVLDTHVPGLAFTPIDAATPPQTRLLAPEPFDEMYIKWLEAQIDLYNGESERYNGSILLFNRELSAFENWYNRTWQPKSTGSWQH